MNLGMEIRVRRTIAGLKQGELARMVGVSQGKMSAYENNVTKPSLETVIKLSDVFGCKVDELVKDEIQNSFCSGNT